MESPEFDKFAENYSCIHKKSILLSGEDLIYFAEYKIKDLKKVLSEFTSVPCNSRILDFGAGIGSTIPFVGKYFPNAQQTCLDVSANSLKIAASNFGNLAEYVAFDGENLPFSDNCFDVAYALCVFHHIPTNQHLRLLRELWRVIKPTGIILIYEHNPLNPLTVRSVKLCPLDKNAIIINSAAMRNRIKSAGFLLPSVRYRVFFPRILSPLRWMENWLTWAPLGAQYYVVATKPSSNIP